MNLVIDIGNSRTKAAIFSGTERVESFLFDELSIARLQELKTEFPGTEQAILSTVASVQPEVRDWLRAGFSRFLEFSHQTPVPIRNNYLTPATLGLDRLAAAVGAQALFPGSHLLVIDAGTAITFDLVEADGVFAGGNISPGLRSRFRALHEFTRQLPLVSEAEPVPLLGRSTEEAIRAGVVNGLLLELDGTIDRLREASPGIQVILTGGDAPFFERRLKNTIFVQSEITLIGLNRILEYNVDKP